MHGKINLIGFLAAFRKTAAKALLLSVFLPARAGTVSFQADGFSGTVVYNESAVPGDAVFARMTMRIPKNSKKKAEQDPAAVLELLKDDKKIDSSAFYFLNKSRRQTNPEMLCGLPLSAWLDADESYSLRIILTTGASAAQKIALPFSMESRTFNREVLPLDSRNSAIKNDVSRERTEQIEKLNGILETVMPQDIYSLRNFVMPVTTTRQTAYFGDRRVYQFTDGKTSSSMHYGNDYGVPEGTEVGACAEGRVVMAENRISTGWSVVIEHLPGLYSLYYHMSRLSVKEGQYVKQGEKIGESGATGLATGPHLHWEVRLNMCAVRPEFFLKDFTFSSGAAY